jgi:membrane-associated phospholipid phosphatase
MSPTQGAAQRLWQFAITAALLVSFLLAYAVAGDAATDPYCTRTVLDDPWPVVPVAVWLYLSPYLVGVVAVSALPRLVFRGFCLRGLVLGLVHLAVFFLAPTVVARADLDDSVQGLSASLLRLIYAADHPTNAAPSAHVSVTILITWALWRAWPKTGIPAALWCLGVCATVVLTGQHHVLDALAGAALVAVVLVAFDRFEKREGPRPR